MSLRRDIIDKFHAGTIANANIKNKVAQRSALTTIAADQKEQFLISRTKKSSLEWFFENANNAQIKRLVQTRVKTKADVTKLKETAKSTGKTEILKSSLKEVNSRKLPENALEIGFITRKSNASTTSTITSAESTPVKKQKPKKTPKKPALPKFKKKKTKTTKDHKDSPYAEKQKLKPKEKKKIVTKIKKKKITTKTAPLPYEAKLTKKPKRQKYIAPRIDPTAWAEKLAARKKRAAKSSSWQR